MKSSKSQNIHKQRGLDRDVRNGRDHDRHRGNPSFLNNKSNNNNNRTTVGNNNNSMNSVSSNSMNSSNSLHIQRNNSLRSTSLQSLPDSQLTAKPHAFSGAVLNPKHARDLTPKVVLNITHTLGQHALENANAYSTHGPNSHSADSNNSYNGNGNANGNGNGNNNKDNPRSVEGNVMAANEAKVQYTVWITEAWSCLGWAEPSAALFWEMATTYHILHVAARSIEVEETEMPLDGEDGEDGEGQYMGIQRTLSQSIPPILSCGSSASMESIENKKKERRDRDVDDRSSPNRPGSPNATSPVRGHNQLSPKKGGQNDKQKNPQNNKASAASAKELPVWLVGMYLLLHCEEGVFRRNVSGEDAQRFDALMAKQNAASGIGEIWKDGLVGKGVDFGMLLMQPSLSLRAHLHGGWMNSTNCTIYLLRHLRKFLLLSAIPHNADAQMALESLYQSVSSHDKEYTDRVNPSNSRSNPSSLIDSYGNFDADEILRCHDEEHGDIGLRVHLTNDDLERLNFVLQAPHGGLIDDPPLFISNLMPAEDFAVYGSISLEDVEREIRQHLELELLNGDEEDVESISNDLSKLDLSKGGDVDKDDKTKGKGRAEVDITNRNNSYKELTYSNVRGKTVLIEPNAKSKRLQQTANNNNNNNANNDTHANVPSLCTNGRLHDISVSECSDAHMYFLQPFEHATVSACSNCTIVVGAVAGLLHVVDCEKMTITSAARRVLVSNCNDVSLYIFTPSPSLLVGINKNCQFAPYNTYYDGLREDLLATGLAAAVVSADNVVIDDSIHGPALQCASNKWKQPVELNKICDVLITHSMPKYSDDKALSNEDTMQTPTLVPASEFQLLFVPIESNISKKERLAEEAMHSLEGKDEGDRPRIGSIFSHCLADVLQLSPFRLPTEYERRALVKADRMRSLQQLIQTDLTREQQIKLEEELNRGFRDWLVTSGNLRQVLDLVHLESKSSGSRSFK